MSASANVTSGRVFGPDGPRVAIAGFFIECNRFAPVSTAAEFRRGGLDLAGDALARELAADSPRVLPDTVGFLSTMRSAGPWTPVPLRMAAAQPGGPVEHDYFTSLRDEIVARLRAVAPVDGVFISAHGAALTTGCEDPDGELFEAMREAVGPDVPIVAVFDLHANVSERMTRALSAFIAYRTNPHVDLHERGVDAARALMRLWREGPGVVERVGLPFVPPAPTQLIAPGTPYRELIDLADPTVAGDIENVSLCGGFALADSPKCGFSVVVSAVRGQRHAARERALALAREVWDRRERFALRLVSLDDAVRRACEAGRSGDGPRGILADVADNPGGGAGGNTIALLRALLDARARRAARRVHRCGVGRRGAPTRAGCAVPGGLQPPARRGPDHAALCLSGSRERVGRRRIRRPQGHAAGLAPRDGTERAAGPGRGRGGGDQPAPAASRSGATRCAGRGSVEGAHAGGQEPRRLPCRLRRLHG